MVIKEKLGNLSSFARGHRAVDRLSLAWYECSKRILHKRTEGGREVVMKFLNEAQHLQQDDVLYADDACVVVVDVLPCEAIVIRPETMYEMAFACYEIGNKHLPLFYNEGCLLLPYDAPTFRLLQASGLTVQVQHQRLTQPLRTTVQAHSHEGGSSLFSRILKLTTPGND